MKLYMYKTTLEQDQEILEWKALESGVAEHKESTADLNPVVSEFSKSNDKVLVIPGLTSEQRKNVHTIAQSLCIKHFSSGDGDERVITLAKEDAIIGTPKSAKLGRSELLQNAHYKIPEAASFATLVSQSNITKSTREREKETTQV